MFVHCDLVNGLFMFCLKTLPDLRRCKLRNFRHAVFLRKVKFEIITFLEAYAVFPPTPPLAGMNACTKVAEEYCWVITQVAGKSCCSRVSGSVMGFAFQLDCFVYR
jgi:hypothetical protein